MKNKKIETYKVYCDGACEPNPGCGGYCSIIFKAGDIEPRVIITGGEKYTTNNRMEIMGVLSAFSYIKNKSNITFFSDSQYVVNSINIWLANWKKKGRQMKNMDLWNKVWTLKQKHTIKGVWIKGHAGNFYNEIADSLSLEAIDKANSFKRDSFQDVKIIL
jgi:ribonuclease HI